MPNIQNLNIPFTLEEIMHLSLKLVKIIDSYI